MDLQITPKKLSGTVTPPPSKSQAHRLAIAAVLSNGISTVRGVAMSQDVEATLRCLTALGGRWRETAPGVLEITGTGGRRTGADLPLLDCGESGSTLRFFIPIALAATGGGVFTGRGRLMERPQGPYFDLFREKGIFFEQKDGVLTVRGRLTPREYRLAGNVSSQFFTGLLFALPLLEGDSVLIPTTRLESVGYINMTREAMALAGVHTQWREGSTLFIPGNQRYQPLEAAVEADWSQAAFWYAAQGLGNAVTIAGLNPKSIQGDRVMASFAEMLRGEPLHGGVTAPIWGPASAAPARPDRQIPARPGWSTPCVGSVSLPLTHCPDLAPPLAAWGALLNGDLYLKDAGRLRIKESDRLATITAALRALGADVTEEPERLIIIGKPSLPGGTVDCAGDHRIAMMAAIAATGCTGPVTLLGAECVKKSYPDFWEVYQSLGGEIHVL
ncbi:3-phosphoshikimate 1-carboxyvinyltransferase [Dysosmobacter sp.]|uniref:3-phosphoshikimate 1-carboxyvinyltransferase n=1 Tax=Dysosmobacter sp. TaxID=2591382 RepID=UPI003AB7A66B